MERSRVRGTDAMDDARLDPATAARVQEIRGQCSLRVAGVHGSLAGRTGRSVRAACLEPGGGHAVLLLSDGALKRWDLDAVERVGRWELPLLRGRRSLGCDGPAPWDVFAIDREGRRWRVAEAAEAWRDEGVIVTDGFVDKMRVGRSVVVSRRWSRWDPRLRATRLHDGAVLWETGRLGRCDPEGLRVSRPTPSKPTIASRRATTRRATVAGLDPNMRPEAWDKSEKVLTAQSAVRAWGSRRCPPQQPQFYRHAPVSVRTLR